MSFNRGYTARSKSPLADDRFFIDLHGSVDNLNGNFPTPVVRRTPSPATSASSEEVIVFSGRGNTHTSAEKHVNWPWLSNNNNSIHNTVAHSEDLSENKRDQSFTIHPLSSVSHKATHTPNRVSVEMETQVRGSKVPANFKRLKPRQKQKMRNSKVEEDTILADYIANIDTDDNGDETAQNTMLRARQVDDMDTHSGHNESGVSETTPRAESNTSYSARWEATDLEAFEGLSTSTEVLAEVQQIVAKRYRPSGTQYLVVLEGYTLDDARWYPVALLGGLTTQHKIRVYEIEQAQFESHSTTSGSDSCLDENERLAQNLQDEFDDLANEQDLLNRHRERMADEHMARLLSKQEKLGLSAHELLLYDGVKQVSPSGAAMRRPHGETSPCDIDNLPGLGEHQSRYEFPSASLMADVLDKDPYSGFDIVDRDRPSIRSMVKGRGGRLHLEFSDGELDQTLQSQWKRDRNKKKIRKEERENLRAHGLLGRKGKAKSKVKHPTGTSLAEVKNEIVDFLGSTAEHLFLPPMSDIDRKLVHEIANIFKFKSKSFGKDFNRFPVLYRTSQSLAFDERHLNRKMLCVFTGKRQPPRPKVTKGRMALAGAARGGGGDFAKAGVSYHDGDVVGASAPELGQENRGRAMLEKMGWSTGTALGALNNKGIMEPVAHVVKNSKAGLG
ncbi:MAG: hypothetical protein Q9195_009276 [Heterodermia aff. obscurata]